MSKVEYKGVNAEPFHKTKGGPTYFDVRFYTSKHLVEVNNIRCDDPDKAILIAREHLRAVMDV